jgi:hypothetical protein
LVPNIKRRKLKDYDPHYLLLAVNAVKSGKMTAVVASKFYGVPRTTIITRIARNIENLSISSFSFENYL